MDEATSGGRRNGSGGALQASLMRYIWTHSRPQQIWILLVVVVSLPTYFLSLDLPKQIVNGPILGKGFEHADAHTTWLRIAIDVPHALDPSGTLVLFPGFELDRYGALFALSAMFLLLVVINGLFKYYINTYKGRLGEDMLRRLRFELIDRVLRFPHAQFKRVKASEISTMVQEEVEPLGGFIGDAFVQPMFLGGQALTAMVFILVQSVWLGGLAAAIIAVQFLVIPRLRRRLLVLGKERQISARANAGRVGELVEGIAAVHVNDTSNYERANADARLWRIFEIRYEIYQRKFFVKFLNNFLAQLTPFLFYAVGGWFALEGRLDVGQLVAVIGAYKDLPSPIKELIDWDQQRLDVEVKYDQVAEQFSVDEMLPPERQALVSAPVPPLAAPIRVNGLSVNDDSGATLLERVSLEFAPGERVAIVGAVGSGGEVLAEVLAGLMRPSGGRVCIGDTPLGELPQAVTGRRLAYAGAETFLPEGTLRDALYYVLKHAPLRPPPEADAAASRTNPGHLDPRADWVDYASAGASGPADLLDQTRRVLNLVSLREDVIGLGLRGEIDPDAQPALAAAVIELRCELRRRLRASGESGLVETFDPERYCRQATLVENLLFGTPVGPAFAPAGLAGNAFLREVLADTGVDRALFEMGRELAGTLIELFKDLPPDHPFFEQLSFMDAEQIPEYRGMLARLGDFATAEADDRRRLIRLTLAYIEPRHRLGLLDEALMARLVEARTRLHQGLPERLRGSIEFYDPDRYNRAATLQDNILLGRVAHGAAGGTERVVGLILHLIEEFGLQDAVLDVGLDFNVGSGGKRLSVVQRQKLVVARALLKRPDYAIFNRPLSALDPVGQREIVERLLAAAAGSEGPPFAAVCVLSNAQLAHAFDRVVVFERGQVVAQGAPDELARTAAVYAALAG